MIKQIVILIILLVCCSGLFCLTGCSKPGDYTVQQAMAAYGSKDFNKALELFDKVLSEDTNYSPEVIYTFIANVYMAQEELVKAIEYQEKSLNIRDDYRGYVTLGVNYHALGDDTKALLNYNKAVAMDPTLAEAYASIGALYIGQKNAELAVENLEKALNCNSNLYMVPANLAVAYAMAGRFSESDKMIQKAIELRCPNINDFISIIEEIK